MRTAIALFPGFTPLDVVGPYHALAHLPERELVFVAERAGPVSDGGAFTLDATVAFDDVGPCDIVLVPGGLAAITMSREPTGGALVEWLAAVAPGATWVTSACTGSLLLGAAGLLHGRRATSHWYCLDELAAHGAVPTRQRVVFDGEIVTAAGVSAGIDMSLRLTELIAGTRHAQGAQLDMEYDPEPPWSSGHPSTASADVTAWLTEMYDEALRPD